MSEIHQSVGLYVLHGGDRRVRGQSPMAPRSLTLIRRVFWRRFVLQEVHDTGASYTRVMCNHSHSSTRDAPEPGRGPSPGCSRPEQKPAPG